MSEFSAEIQKIWEEVEKLLTQRHKSYGEGNLLIYGLLGIVIRIEDKLSRIWTQIEHNAIYESTEDKVQVSPVVEDALKDIIGYCVNALRLLRKQQLLPMGLRSYMASFSEMIPPLWVEKNSEKE